MGAGQSDLACKLGSGLVDMARRLQRSTPPPTSPPDSDSRDFHRNIGNPVVFEACVLGLGPSDSHIYNRGSQSIHLHFNQNNENPIFCDRLSVVALPGLHPGMHRVLNMSNGNGGGNGNDVGGSGRNVLPTGPTHQPVPPPPLFSSDEENGLDDETIIRELDSDDDAARKRPHDGKDKNVPTLKKQKKDTCASVATSLTLPLPSGLSTVPPLRRLGQITQESIDEAGK